jgi:hypothetical protein
MVQSIGGGAGNQMGSGSGAREKNGGTPTGAATIDTAGSAAAAIAGAPGCARCC